ncbi:MAG TPA: hypothetical protein VG102_04100 [Candidatus Paceibacterota bacterium]|jgi:hypothetical protein|nr:hypothetical protein [Candidatus Paceibacterota bacterium]
MDIVRRLVWFAIVATVACFAIFVVLGNFVSYAGNAGTVPVRDVVSPGTHRLSGMLVLPLSCDELSVETRQVTPALYQLMFQTWQDPSVPCPNTPTPRLFQTIVFAPSVGVAFTATLDGKAFPITILTEASSSPSL